MEETECIETEEVFLEGVFGLIVFLSLAGFAHNISIVAPLISASALLERLDVTL